MKKTCTKSYKKSKNNNPLWFEIIEVTNKIKTQKTTDLTEVNMTITNER